MPLPRIVNWEVISQPYNWITVALILSFAALAVTVLANGGRLPNEG